MKDIQDITESDLENIDSRAKELVGKAMQLTDAWGAMFVMDEDSLKNIASTLGFSKEVSDQLYEKVRGLSYVVKRGGKSKDVNDEAAFTWHGPDTAFLILRGAASVDSAMINVTDESLEKYIQDNSDVFAKVMDALPAYTQQHMFSPEVASKVLAAFGATVSPDKLFELAPKYGGTVSEDLEGRRGISAQFIRSTTLTIAARVSGGEGDSVGNG